jgi:four helix bundle protein
MALTTVRAGGCRCSLNLGLAYRLAWLLDCGKGVSLNVAMVLAYPQALAARIQNPKSESRRWSSRTRRRLLRESKIGKPAMVVAYPQALAARIQNPKSKIGNEMTEQEFKDRTKKVALRIIRVVEALPATKTADVLGRQLLRSGTSVGANYRSACRGRSPADVIAKLAIVEEEADESIYWLELLIESGTLRAPRLTDLMDELNQIVAMVVASQKTIRAQVQNPKSKIQNRK